MSARVVAVLLASMLGVLAGEARAQHALLIKASGRDVYVAACANCHGDDGRGATRSQVGFADPLPDFTDCSYASREAAQDWETIVREGGLVRRFSRRMPSFGLALGDDQIRHVVAYVRSLCGDRRWPRGELNFPRPMATEKAYPEDEAIITSSAITRGGERALSNLFIYEKRIGARGQWEIGIPVLAKEKAPGDGGGLTTPRLGDVTLALKRTLLHDGDRGSILTVATELAVATGDWRSGFGSGTAVIEPQLLVGQALPSNAFIQLQTGVELPANQARAAREAFWRIALGRTLGSRAGRSFTPIVEFTGARTLGHDDATELDAIPQMQITLSRRRHIAASLGMRMPMGSAESRSRPREFVAYVLWDWFDGGLLDGW